MVDTCSHRSKLSFMQVYYTSYAQLFLHLPHKSRGMSIFTWGIASCYRLSPPILYLFRSYQQLTWCIQVPRRILDLPMQTECPKSTGKKFVNGNAGKTDKCSLLIRISSMFTLVNCSGTFSIKYAENNSKKIIAEVVAGRLMCSESRF